MITLYSHRFAVEAACAGTCALGAGMERSQQASKREEKCAVRKRRSTKQRGVGASKKEMNIWASLAVHDFKNAASLRQQN